MGDIYKLAKAVVVFLGAPSPSPLSFIDELFKFLNRFSDGDTLEAKDAGRLDDSDDSFQNSGVDKNAVCKGFAELFLRPWFGRIWTLQEFYLASDEPVWYWGRLNASNTSLKRDICLLMSTCWDLYEKSEANSTFCTDVQNIINKPLTEFIADARRISDLISRRAKTHGFDIPSRLYCSLSARATDPRDMVYGLREIFDPVFRRVFVPDYFMRVGRLFACLTVFLIQFEACGDLLWWYPFRYDEKRVSELAGGLYAAGDAS
jgi:hypothetical protein